MVRGPPKLKAPIPALVFHCQITPLTKQVGYPQQAWYLWCCACVMLNCVYTEALTTRRTKSPSLKRPPCKTLTASRKRW